MEDIHIQPEEFEYEEPVGPVETTLAAEWRNFFRIDNVGRNHDFFGLGGNSVQGLELMERVATRLELELPVYLLFQNPTPRLLAEQIESLGPAAAR